MKTLTTLIRGRLHRSTALAAVLLVLAVALVYAQAGGGFDLSWNTVDGGGGSGSTASTGGIYAVEGTIGQPDAGAMTGGIYGVSGGFWAAESQPKLIGHVVWEGRPAQPSALQSLPITLTLRHSGGTAYEFSGLSTDPSGYFSVNLGGLQAGSYTYRAKGPHATPNSNTTPGFLAISGTLTVANLNTSVTAEVGVMRAGDANNDNVVEVLDFNALKNTFGKSSGDPGFDPTADFNGDNVVEVLDFNLLKLNFGQAGAQPVRRE